MTPEAVRKSIVRGLKSFSTLGGNPKLQAFSAPPIPSWD